MADSTQIAPARQARRAEASEGPAERVHRRPDGGEAGGDDEQGVTTFYGDSRPRRLREVPRKYRALYRRAWARKSRKAAIRAQCLECVGFSSREVELCTAPACPLFAFRLKG